MTPEELKAQMQELQQKLDALKESDPAAYERMLAEFGDALEDLNRELSSL